MPGPRRRAPAEEAAPRERKGGGAGRRRAQLHRKRDPRLGRGGGVAVRGVRAAECEESVAYDAEVAKRKQFRWSQDRTRRLTRIGSSTPGSTSARATPRRQRRPPDRRATATGSASPCKFASPERESRPWGCSMSVRRPTARSSSRLAGAATPGFPRTGEDCGVRAACDGAWQDCAWRERGLGRCSRRRIGRVRPTRRGCSLVGWRPERTTSGSRE